VGYNLYIGNAEVRADLKERHAHVAVAAKELPESPLNSNDEHTNYVFPSYTQWAEFARNTGLSAVFYGDGGHRAPWFRGASGKEYDGLLSRHPGAVAMTEDHHAAFVAAREDYEPTSEDDVYNQRRLDWLVWWTRWALDNCEFPTFYNS
jgi:hypothetical protein